MIQVHAAYGTQGIGNGIPDAGISEGDKILVNLVTDAVKRRGYDADQHQQARVAFDPKGLVGPVEQDPHNGIRAEMQKLVAEFERGNVFD